MTRGILAGLVLLAGGNVPLASAAEDGGGRSVFATGLGGRALGMGGAYVSLADDASATMWNAGGLGYLQTAQFEFSHAQLGELGFTEQHLGLGLPSWRWGTFALSARHFGVDGIELRDERNVLQDSNLSDRQVEVALAYGRMVAPGVGLGLAAKLQQHSLAGAADTGLGADLGLLLEPIRMMRPRSLLAPRWTVGFSIRNLVEPTLRLDEESVPDPTGVRLGTAWRHPLGPYRWIVAAVDLEKTREMDSRSHLGLEVGLLRDVALRVGWNAGEMTAGLRSGWRGVALDYSFENGTLDPVHRVGLSWQFGPTVEQRRLAAVQNQEREIQDRLETAYSQRMAKRADELLGEARELVRGEDPDAALERIASARTLGVNEEDANLIEAEAHLQRALDLEAEGQLGEALVDLTTALRLRPHHNLTQIVVDRIRNEQQRDQKRSEELRAIYDAATTALSEGQYAAAVAGFERVLELSPKDAEATRMLALANNTLSERIDGFVGSARAWIDAGSWRQAEGTLAQIESLDPDHASLAELRAKLVRAQRAAEVARQTTPVPVVTTSTDSTATAQRPTPVETKPAKPILTADQRREVEDLYRRGIESMEAGRADEAVRYWEFVWSTDPSYGAVGELLEQEYLSRGMEHFAAGRLDEAIEVWTRALNTDPEDARTIRYLERAHEKLQRMEQIQGARR